MTRKSLSHYFSGQATALQKQLIEEWAKDEQNREFFYECLAEWEAKHSQFDPDVQAALMRHQGRMSQ